MPATQRINIDRAARTIAAKHGLQVLYRESWNSPGERLVCWQLSDARKAQPHRLMLTCTDGAGVGCRGWLGALRLERETPEGLVAVASTVLVDVIPALARRAATALTYERLCEWAERHVPRAAASRANA